LTTPDIIASSRRALAAASLAASLAGMLALQACAPKPPVAGHAALPIYAIDQAGPARTCAVSPFTPAAGPVAGKEATTTMTMANDGGWCAISVHQDGPAPYAAGLLTTRPEHGKVFIHSVGDETRIDYTPEQRFGGNDGFAVQLLPGDAVIRVAVTVSGPAQAEPVAPVANPATTKPPAATKPAVTKHTVIKKPVVKK